MEQREVLCKAMYDVTNDGDVEKCLSDLLYTASETGVISISVDEDDVAALFKLTSLAIYYAYMEDGKVPDELRM